jgi:hypothetical protein
MVGGKRDRTLFGSTSAAGEALFEALEVGDEQRG